MNRPFHKPTIQRLMAIISLLCVALAFVRYAATSWSPREVEFLTVLILLATNLLACFQERWRVFWIGFGIFGWSYLALSSGSSMGKYLPTTRLLNDLGDRLYSVAPIVAFEDVDYEAVAARKLAAARFRAAGQSVVSLAFALFGGVGAAVLIKGSRDDPGTPLARDGSLLNRRWYDPEKPD